MNFELKSVSLAQAAEWEVDALLVLCADEVLAASEVAAGGSSSGCGSGSGSCNSRMCRQRYRPRPANQ